MEVPREVFRRQIAYIVQHHTVIGLDDLVEGISRPRDLPKNALAINFDDGFMDNFDHALDVLSDFQIRAAFFIIGDSLDNSNLIWPHHLYALIDRLTGKPFVWNKSGKTLFSCPSIGNGEKLRLIALAKKQSFSILPDERPGLIEDLCIQNRVRPDSIRAQPIFMQEGQLRKLRECGHIVGAHSMTHAELVGLSPERLAYEVRSSIALLKKLGASDFVAYAYPYGTFRHFNRITKAMLRQAGAHCGLTTVEGLNSATSDLYALQRIEVGPFSNIELRTHLSGAVGDIKQIMRHITGRA